VSSFEFTAAGLQSAINTAGTTPQHELIVLRTTGEQHTITLTAELTINI